MASVLILEQGSNSDRDAESIAELRRELNLPQPEAIEPAGQPINGLPLVRVPRLKLEAVSDDDLVVLVSPRDPGRRSGGARCGWLAKRFVGHPSRIEFRRPMPISG